MPQNLRPTNARRSRRSFTRRIQTLSHRRTARNLQSVVSASLHFLLGYIETLHLPARCQSQFQGITTMNRITILILLVGFIPSMKTAFLTDNYLSLFDLSFAFLCFLLGTAVQEALDRRCKWIEFRNESKPQNAHSALKSALALILNKE